MNLTIENKKQFSKSFALIILILTFFYTTIYVSQISKNSLLSVSAFSPHPAISITDDSGFTVYPGSGTVLEPYIIDAYSIITAEDYGIYIKDTTKYFVISNCYIDANIFGIYLDNIANGTAILNNNTCINNDEGIRLSYSHHNTLIGNNCTNNLIGITLFTSSHYNTLYGNNCTNNGDSGIRTSSSYHNTFVNNNCTNNINGITIGNSYNNFIADNYCSKNHYGMELASSSNNTLIGNYFSHNSHAGIRIEVWFNPSINNTLIDNSCTNAVYGIYLSSSHNNTLTNNNCTNATDNGIYLSSSHNNTLTNNNCTNAVDDGIYLSSSHNNALTNNNCTNAVDDGIYLSSSHNNTLTNNICIANTDGIILFSSHNNTITDNICVDSLDGVELSLSHNNTLIDNICTNNADGIYLSSSQNNTLISNNCTQNFFGIYLSSSHNNTLASNNCTSNSVDGIRLNKANNSIIFDNYLIDNIEYGVYIRSLTYDNQIYNNVFYNNNLGGTSQGYDAGINNKWYDLLSLHGNYWSDWDGSEYYTIDGISNSLDPFPSEYPPLYPSIENISHSPDPPTDLEPIIVSATVTDSSGIYSVTLYYQINAGEWLNTSMSHVSGSNYQGTIGPFVEYTLINYYLKAIDNSPEHNEAVEDNDGLYYQLVVTEGDSDPPSITAVSHYPSNPTELDSIVISATVTDSSGIFSVSLHYRVNGGLWTVVTMTLSTGSTYQAIIGPFSDGDTIEYFITAIDDSTIQNEATEDNSGLYYSFVISSSIPELSTIYPLMLVSIFILSTLIALVIQKRRKE